MYVLGKQGVRQAANDIVNDIVSGVELRYDACRVCAEAMRFIISRKCGESDFHRDDF